ncbi:hypothetical protein ACFQE1_06835 [Halobium palmae]|uniref:PIN domain-containing protein n=1 Tax=Halobium palmae TaxID=1776492 RepID=A0ABD5RXC8_9EURY
MTDAFVIDNCIFSSFMVSDWFDSMDFWRPDYDLLATRRVWEEEFLPFHEVEGPPDWLCLHEVDLSGVDVQALGPVSKKDWSCIALAEDYDGDAAVVTNDHDLKMAVENRGLRAIWGTRFVIDTFERCGISVEDFEEGRPKYIDDATLPEPAIRELRDAEKI